MAHNKRDGLGGIFPGIEDSADPNEELTLGYPDLLGGLTIKALSEMSVEDLAIVHRYADIGRVGFLAHLRFILGLLTGIEERDPERKSQGAIELAQIEIDGAKSHVELLGRYDLLPFVQYVPDPAVGPDAFRRGWNLYPAMQEKDVWVDDFGGVFDQLGEVLHDSKKIEEVAPTLMDITMRNHFLGGGPGGLVVVLS